MYSLGKHYDDIGFIMINEELHRIEVCTVILMQFHFILYWKLHIGN